MTITRFAPPQSVDISPPFIPESMSLPVIREDLYRLLLENSEISYFDYDVPTDAFTLSAVAPGGARRAECYQPFLPMLRANSRAPLTLRREMLSVIRRASEAPEPNLFSICLDLFGSGEYRWYAASVRGISDGAGHVNRVIGSLRDVQGEQQDCLRLKKGMKERKALEQRARTDAVTGLYNRATIEELIDKAFAQPDARGYFFIFDVDNFKSVNDTLGHAEGDRLLRLIAAALRSRMRQSDLFGRVGGDEFVALLRGLEDREAAAARAEAMLQAVRAIEHPSSWKRQTSFSVTIGCAAAPSQGACFDALYRAADASLYTAKEAGKDRYHLGEG